MPEPPLGIWTDPVIDFNRREALSIIGGYVYRGERLPTLQGKYVFADFSRGRIWALPYTRAGGQLKLGELEYMLTAEFRNRENGITSFGVDDAGELYVLRMPPLGSNRQDDAYLALLESWIAALPPTAP